MPLLSMSNLNLRNSVIKARNNNRLSAILDIRGVGHIDHIYLPKAGDVKFIHMKNVELNYNEDTGTSIPPTLHWYGDEKTTNIIVPTTQIGAYQAASNWSNLYQDEELILEGAYAQDRPDSSALWPTLTNAMITLPFYIKKGGVIVIRTPYSATSNSGGYAYWLYKIDYDQETDTMSNPVAVRNVYIASTAAASYTYPSGTAGELQYIIKEDGWYVIRNNTNNSTGTHQTLYMSSGNFVTRIRVYKPGYSAARAMYNWSYKKHNNLGIYDGISNIALADNPNMLWPEDMMYWMGYGDMEYTPQEGQERRYLEPEDYMQTVAPINPVILTTTDTSMDITDRTSANAWMNYLKSIDYVLDSDATNVYKWQLEEPTTVFPAAIPATYANSFTDCSLMKYFTNRAITSIPGSRFAQATAMTKFAFPPQLKTVGTANNPSPNPIELYIPSLEQFFGVTYSNSSTTYTKIANSKVMLEVDGEYQKIVEFVGDHRVPDSISVINDFALYNYQGTNGATGIRSIDIHQDVESIGSSAFYGCKDMTYMRLRGNSVKPLGGSALYGVPTTGTTDDPEAFLHVWVDNPQALFDYLSNSSWVGVLDSQFFVKESRDEYDRPEASIGYQTLTSDLSIQAKIDGGEWIDSTDESHDLDDASTVWVRSNFANLTKNSRENMEWEYSGQTEDLLSQLSIIDRSTLVKQVIVPSNYARYIQFGASVVTESMTASAIFLLRGIVTNRPNIQPKAAKAESLTKSNMTNWFKGATNRLIMGVDRIDNFDPAVMKWTAKVGDDGESVELPVTVIADPDRDDGHTVCMVDVGVGNNSTGIFAKKYHTGKSNTEKLARYSTDNLDNNPNNSEPVWYPAAKHCYDFKQGNGVWWLPDMCELGKLMLDENFNRVKATLDRIRAVSGTSAAQTITNSAHRWSSSRYSATYAWNFSNDGFSNNRNFYNGYSARPVSLLEIV